MRSVYFAEVATVASGTPFTVTGVLKATPPLKVPSPLTLTVELTVTGAENDEVACTVSVLLLPPFSTTLPLAEIAVLPAKVAVVRKLLAALTVRV